MSQNIFCKFNHATTLQARSNRIRLFTGAPEFVVYNYELYREIICDAVNVRENVVHLLTTNGVYEVNAEGNFDGSTFTVTYIGGEL